MAVAAAEPRAHTPMDVLARVKHTLLQGKTARIVVFSGIKFRLTDNVGVWIDVHVSRDDNTAEFGMSLYGGHGGSLVLGLLVPDGKASLVQNVRAPDAETALRAIWDHLYKFAQDLLAGTATAAVAETVVLHKTQDVVATISTGAAGYTYEIAALSAAGATALANIPRTGVVPGPDIGAVHAAGVLVTCVGGEEDDGIKTFLRTLEAWRQHHSRFSKLRGRRHSYDTAFVHVKVRPAAGAPLRTDDAGRRIAPALKIAREAAQEVVSFVQGIQTYRAVPAFKVIPDGN